MEQPKRIVVVNEHMDLPLLRMDRGQAYRHLLRASDHSNVGNLISYLSNQSNLGSVTMVPYLGGEAVGKTLFGDEDGEVRRYTSIDIIAHNLHKPETVQVVIDELDDVMAFHEGQKFGEPKRFHIEANDVTFRDFEISITERSRYTNLKEAVEFRLTPKNERASPINLVLCTQRAFENVR